MANPSKIACSIHQQKGTSLIKADVLLQDGPRVPVRLRIYLRVVGRPAGVRDRDRRLRGLEHGPRRHRFLRQRLPKDTKKGDKKRKKKEVKVETM